MEKKETIRTKLMKIQVELKAPKNQYNSFGKYKYRNIEDIQEALKPLLLKHNVAMVISDEMVEVGGRVYVKATAKLLDCDSEGDFIETTAYAREAEDKKGMDSAQVTGATSSYARKYCVAGMMLLDDTKDVDSEEYQAETKKPDAKKNPVPTPAPAQPKVHHALTPRERLRLYCQENFIDPQMIVQACGLNPNSTDEDYKNALQYAIESTGG